MINQLKEELFNSVRIRSIKELIILGSIIIISLPIMYIVAGSRVVSVIITITLILNSFYRYKSESFTVSMPIKRDDIIYSKYLFALIISVGSSIVTFLAEQAIFKDMMVHQITFEDIIMSLSINIIVSGIVIPILTIRGVRILDCTLYVALTSMIVLIIQLIIRGILIIPMNGLNTINEFRALWILYGLLMISFTVFVTSLKISISLYKRKEIR